MYNSISESPAAFHSMRISKPEMVMEVINCGLIGNKSNETVTNSIALDKS